MDKKLLYAFLIGLIGLIGVKYALPTLELVFAIDLIIYFASGSALMIIMHWVGFIEGLREAQQVHMHEGGVFLAETTMH